MWKKALFATGAVVTVALAATALIFLTPASDSSIGTEAQGDPSAPPMAEGQTGDVQRPAAQAYDANEIVVRYRDGIGPAARRSIRADERLSLVRPVRVGNAELLRVNDGRALDRALTSLRRRSQVLYAEPNFEYRTTAVPDDPQFGQLWGLRNDGRSVNGTSGTAGADIGAVDAWAQTQGSSDVAVAVVDTGVAVDHPDLAPNIWTNPRERNDGTDSDGNGYVDDVRGWDWVGRDNDASDMHGHGTHVAGTIAARGNNGQGVTGVSWRASIVPLRVLDVNGTGSTADIAEAFAYAGRLGIPIVNASLGGAGASRLMLEAITGATRSLFVVAAGNAGADNDATATYPCNYASSNLVCVAATDQRDRLASFSNYGASTVHLAAPGVNILSTLNEFGPARLTDDFERDIGGRWVLGGARAAWARTTSVARSPQHSLADTPGSDYENNSDTWIGLADGLDLTGSSGCRVTFASLTDTQQGRDFLSLEVSRGRDGPWTRVFSTSGSTSGRFVVHRVDISEVAGQRDVFLRFRFQTDSSVTASGIALDDVAVTCLATPSADRLAYLNGTSMATPHVAGVAALVLSARTDMTPEDVKRALLAGVDKLESLAGRVSTGGRLSAAGALPQAAPPAVVVSGDAFARAFQDDQSIAVDWQAEAGRSVDAFDVRYRRAGHNSAFESFVAWRTGTTAQRATLSADMGFTYCFSARASQPEGPWSTPQRCTAVPLNDSALARSGEWTTRSSTSYFGGQASVSSARGARLTASVAARQIALVATRCSGCGTVDVFLGSTRLRRISLDAATTATRQIINVASFDAVTSGSLSIRVVSSGKQVRIEGLGISRV